MKPRLRPKLSSFEFSLPMRLIDVQGKFISGGWNWCQVCKKIYIYSFVVNILVLMIQKEIIVMMRD